MIHREILHSQSRKSSFVGTEKWREIFKEKRKGWAAVNQSIYKKRIQECISFYLCPLVEWLKSQTHFALVHKAFIILHTACND